MEWSRAWLAYRRQTGEAPSFTGKIRIACAPAQVLQTAADELIEAFFQLYGVHTVCVYGEGEEACSVVLRVSETHTASLGTEGFLLTYDKETVRIEAAGAAGVLYGTFHLLRQLAQGQEPAQGTIQEVPDNPFRMLNHWDNADGSIERGYAGQSFFFEEERLLVNARTRDYARLAASVGINAVVINNVNVRGAATELISERYFEPLAALARVLEGYAIRLYLSLNFAAPLELTAGANQAAPLDTADPCEPRVAAWWEARLRLLFERIPNLGGFLVKADSEGRPGPFTYGRTHAEGANMLARAVKPYGGTIIWRCFVYNCQQDWRDRKTDRARAGYDNFMPLDGQFDDNVILQIKNGPMDFQVREPVSPLFGGLASTNQILEVQAAQEYTGQQRHVCYLVPMWKEILAFRTHCKPEGDTVADIVSGRAFAQTSCGMAAVANTGNDFNWCGHELAAANFYGFGRLAWKTALTAEEIAREWSVQTFSAEKMVTQTVCSILLRSWPAYESYTSPLGIGWMVSPNHHYGPSVDGYEYDRWGTYHRADQLGIGVDRTLAGTGYTEQYREPNAAMYASVEQCPQELLLFFHRVLYTDRLPSGKTLIQHIYDSHFDGAAEAERFEQEWKTLEGKIDAAAFARAAERFAHQTRHAAEWRDVINSYFYRKSGIPDAQGRALY